MYRATIVSDPRSSQAAMTASSHPPIGPYHRIAALLELGFQHQSPAVFPASRPMLWGALRDGPTDYRVHVHVVPASSPEVAAMRGFRDALRADPRLRRRYGALKRAIVAAGPVDPVAFSNAKHDWIGGHPRPAWPRKWPAPSPLRWPSEAYGVRRAS
jgi:GrpB-like predicted nucleotidyltransferase (UPF0157 family)